MNMPSFHRVLGAAAVLGVGLAIMLGGCTEKRVVRQSGIYSSQQLDDLAPGAIVDDPIPPPPAPPPIGKRFDPLGDIWRAIKSPFVSKPTNTATSDNRTLTGSGSNPPVDRGRMRTVTPMQPSSPANRSGGEGASPGE